MDFTVPIQKDTEREIFDYIDLDSMQEMLKVRKADNEASKVVDKKVSSDNLD